MYLTYRLVLGNTTYEWVGRPWLSVAAFCVCVIAAGMVFGLYEPDTLRARSRIVVRSCMTLGSGVTLAYVCLSVLFCAEVSRWLSLFVLVIGLGVGIPLRFIAHEVITSSPIHVLCIGSGDSIRKLVLLLGKSRHPAYRVVGHIEVPCPSRKPVFEPPGEVPRAAHSRITNASDFERLCPCLGMLDDIVGVLEDNVIDQVIVSAELVSDAALGEAVLACLERGCRVADQPTVVEKLLGEVPAQDITTQWFLLADVWSSGGFEALKRIMDVLASLIGSALTLPFWPLIVVAIRLDSRGPAIYKQERVGLHGRRFNMYKFRTMRVDAEGDGARWAAYNDGRVTRVGRFLRKSRLDELPQLWNILKGDMALVGPRPERPEFVHQLAQLIPHYRQRHLIKPGLTGWAQIHYGYGASVEDAHRKLCFDLYYLKHRSIDFDVAIIIRTIGTFILGAR